MELTHAVPPCSACQSRRAQKSVLIRRAAQIQQPPCWCLLRSTNERVVHLTDKLAGARGIIDDIMTSEPRETPVFSLVLLAMNFSRLGS